MQMYRPVLLIFLLLTACAAFSQQPRYTKKHFVATDDTVEFKRIVPGTNGFIRAYLLTNPPIWDVDDDNNTHVLGGSGDVLICLEGQQKNGKKEGTVTVFLIDSLQHDKRYKIWEQTYMNDKLNGEWRYYN